MDWYRFSVRPLKPILRTHREDSTAVVVGSRDSPLEGSDAAIAIGRNAVVAEACYQRAISLARSQGAKSLELRAGSSLARLRQSMGRSDEVGTLLTQIYGWFTEGFDSIDLKGSLSEHRRQLLALSGHFISHCKCLLLTQSGHRASVCP